MSVISRARRAIAGLVITRRVDEEVVIHADGQILATIQVASIDVHRRRAQLRIIAPPAIGIDRAEVFERRLAAAAAGGEHG